MCFEKAIFFVSVLVILWVECSPGPIYTNQFIIKFRNTADIREVLRLEPELKLKKKEVSCFKFDFLVDSTTTVVRVFI